MSTLIDKYNHDNVCEINGKWYIAKPLNYPSLRDRVKDAQRVLNGKSIAVHYKEDE